MKKLDKLDWLRGFASVYVALGHLVLLQDDSPILIRFFFRFGQEAVIIFFILSGFVIYYSYMQGSEEPLINYYIKRFRRIYFPFICALLLSGILVKVNFSISELLGNLLMLQDFGSVKPGNIIKPFLGNNPLWSLSYEWTFYLLFPLIYLGIKNRQWQTHFIGISCTINLLMYLLFPNHLLLVFAYYIIWWTGLELAAYFFGNKVKPHCKTLIIYYVLILAILFIKCLFTYQQDHSISAGVYPYLLLRHFSFAFICLMLALNLTAFTKKAMSLLKPFGYIAPISYSLYIFHYPILVQTSFGLPMYLEIPVKLALLILVCWLIEVILQPVVNKYVRYGVSNKD